MKVYCFECDMEATDRCYVFKGTVICNVCKRSKYGNRSQQ